MNARQILLALLITGASFSVLYLTLNREGEVPLIEVAESPRVPVDPDPATKALVLAGLNERVQAKGNELRKFRNELARQHAEAIELWREGQVSLREVERIEQLLWVARQRVGEIDKKTLHTHLAELFSREYDRLQILYERGLAGLDQLAKARLYVMREQFHAGQDPRDPDGRDYETVRREYLERVHERNATLVEAGLSYREHKKLELLKLAEEFPPIVAQPPPSTAKSD